MKKTFLIAITLLGTGFLFAEDTLKQVIGPFGNLNNTDSSFVIPSDRAQDMLNVDVTPGGRSVKKRKGYATSSTLSVSTSPVHGVYNFYDSAGNSVDLYFNDTRMSGSVGGASPTVIFSTGSNGATYQCVDSQGFGYCQDTGRGLIIKSNGVTYSLITPNNNGTMVAVTPERLVLAGFSATPSRIDFSKASDFTTWTVGGNPTDPYQFTISAPGSRVTHITYAFNRIMWFKDSSFGYILIGNQASASDWVVKTISPNIGTLDNSSVYWEGILYFRGQDGHIYSYDGTNLSKLTRDVQNTISASQTRTSNSWTQTTSANFGGDTFVPTTYIDTETVSGQVQLTFPDNFDSFRDGSNNTKSLWAQFNNLNHSTKAYVSGGNLTMVSQAGLEQFVRTNYLTTDFKGGTTYYVYLSSITPTPLSNQSVFSIYLSSYFKTTFPPNTLNNSFDFQFHSTKTANISLSFLDNSSDGTICSGCQTNVSTVPAAIQIWMSTVNYRITVNDQTIREGSHTFPNEPQILYMGYYWGLGGSTSGYAFVDAFSVIPETATMYSTVNNAPNITSWDAFNATSFNGSGTNSFFLRRSTNPIQILSSTPSWTSIISGNIPTISTGTYFQFRNDMALSYSTGTPPILYDFTQNWFEGSASDKAYATYHRDAIWWAVASGTGATTNNKIIRYDLINQGVNLYDIPMNGMLVRNQSLYFGSVSSGTIYKFGDVDNDNGSAINAYWKSKDFFGDNPFTDKEYSYISVIGASVANSSMTVTYTLNGSSSTSLTIPMYTANNSFSKRNRNLPLGKVGSTFNLRFGNNAADQPFEVFGAEYGIRPKPWAATNP